MLNLFYCRFLNKKQILFFFLVAFCIQVHGQHATLVNAVLNDSLKSLYIQQNIAYHNTSGDTLKSIYLNDWMNAFSNTRTPLAKRFFEEYDRDFHFARQDKKGGTTINSIMGDVPPKEIVWERPIDHPDLIKIIPENPVLPGGTYNISLNYSIKIPNDEFTRYGYGNKGRYQLRYWFITPGVYDNGWQVYSHKNMDDLYIPQLDLDIKFTLPSNLSAISSYNSEKIVPEGGEKTIHLNGKDRLETELYLTNEIVFDYFPADTLHVFTNMDDDGIDPAHKSILIKRIVSFLNENLGAYPHPRILSTRQDYAANPVYGLNQLPKFIRPFPEGFNYDLKQLKTLTQQYLKNTLLINPREEKWVFDAIHTYLMMEYMDEHYPNLKILGSLSEIFGVRWFHASELTFNDQYPLLYLYMARQNLDQPLSTPQDSLVKFNRTLANPYKAGVGLKYLEHFLDKETVSHSIKEFYNEYQLKPTSAGDFERILKKNSKKDIDWFFEDYVGTKQKIDFKIRSLNRSGDSLRVSVKNRTGSGMPIQLYGLNDGKIIYQTWVENVDDHKTVSIPASGVETVALNHEGLVPEINRRNNYRAVGTLINKPFQFRLFKDLENPQYNQLFLMPEFRYNLYDGLTLGANFYNKTLLERNFMFSLTPMYGLKSETLVGSASLSHQIFFDDDDLYVLRYGISGNRFSYGHDLFYQRLTPHLSLYFRDSYMRNGRNERISIRNVNVYRDKNPEKPVDVLDYSVFNVNYSYSNPGLVEHFAGNVDFQLAEKFSKSSVTLIYKKLLENDRQLNFRFFGGAFLYNDMGNSDYFSFALDRPTDYLFDYNYYGRSETTGLFSQQIIMAEGGFKSMLEPQFANQWITTVNASATLWKYVFAYGDVGVVKNRHYSAKVLYDSGIRLSLVQNYFELYFPVYSNEGWEFADGNYDQKIRFIAALDLQTIIGIFTREWF